METTHRLARRRDAAAPRCRAAARRRRLDRRGPDRRHHRPQGPPHAAHPPRTPHLHGARYPPRARTAGGRAGTDRRGAGRRRRSDGDGLRLERLTAPHAPARRKRPPPPRSPAPPASCRHDSRRHDKRGRRLATMQRRRANRRRNARRHIAKAVVTTPGIRAVAVEDLNCATCCARRRAPRSSRGRAGLSELHTFIEHACRLLGVAFCPVHAAGTSLTCHGCGAPGIRETQADFYCPECDRRCTLTSTPHSTSAGGHIRQLEADRRPGRSPSAAGGSPRITGNKYGPVPSWTGTTVYKPQLKDDGVA